MILEPLTIEDMEQIRIWRNMVPETLRTPYFLTKEMQEDYYKNVICNRDSKTRYWALMDYIYGKDGEKKDLFGYGGIENISWENSNGEISLLIAPGSRGTGLGSEAVSLFLDQAFNYLGLEYVHGECYMCGPWGFWQKQVEQYLGSAVVFGHRKRWNGEVYESYQFEFNRESFNECFRAGA